MTVLAANSIITKEDQEGARDLFMMIDLQGKEEL